MSVNRALSGREREYKSQANCQRAGKCILARINAFLGVAHAHSATFDNAPRNQGGSYDDFPFNTALDLSPCDQP